MSRSISTAKLVGLTSSGGYGFTLQKSLAFAYLEPSLLRNPARIEVSIRDDRAAGARAATTGLGPQERAPAVLTESPARIERRTDLCIPRD